MGSTHATTGVIAGLATLPMSHLTDPWHQAAYVGLWAGTAVICDWDHHSASATGMWGFVSRVVSAPLRWLPGGHRWATHDLVLSPAVGTGMCWLLVNATATLIQLATSTAVAVHAPHWFVPLLPFLVAVVPLAMLIGAALKMTLPRGSSALTNMLLSGGLAWWWSQYPADPLLHLLPLVVGGGMVVHILGDGLTTELIPVPIIWLFRRARFGLPLFGTNSGAERALAAVLGLVSCWMVWPLLPSDVRADLLRAVHTVQAGR